MPITEYMLTHDSVSVLCYDLEYYSNCSPWNLEPEYNAPIYRYVPDKDVNWQVHDNENDKHKCDK